MEENIRQQARDDAVNEALIETPDLAKSTEGFIKRVSNKFFERQLHLFPRYCKECAEDNFRKHKFHEKYGNKGKYTDTYGWSDEGDMKFKWDISQDLYLFMTNMIYKEFWEEENKNIRDEFMRKMMSCGGSYDYNELLKWVTLKHGADYKKLS